MSNRCRVSCGCCVRMVSTPARLNVLRTVRTCTFAAYEVGKVDTSLLSDCFALQDTITASMIVKQLCFGFSKVDPQTKDELANLQDF
eukprot:scaffold2315_cov113-Cylindrotheca_fusiformis.AAC.4